MLSIEKTMTVLTCTLHTFAILFIGFVTKRFTSSYRFALSTD